MLEFTKFVYLSFLLYNVFHPQVPMNEARTYHLVYKLIRYKYLASAAVLIFFTTSISNKKKMLFENLLDLNIIKLLATGLMMRPL